MGNAGGFIEPLGITGQVSCLQSGVYAARKIARGGETFDRFARRWDTFYNRLWRLRLNVNAWTNADMDRLATFMGHGIGTVLSRSPLNLLNLTGAAMPFLPVAQDPSSDVGPN